MSDDVIKALLDVMTPEQKAELLGKLQQQTETPKSTEEAVSSNIKRNTVTEDFKVVREQTASGKTPVKFKKNNWQDNGEFKDVETPEVKRTPRKRNAPTKKKVECHVCGKEFTMNANLVYGEFIRCNRCTGR